jgi:predicted AAA+ superfamily ATPase
MLFNMENLPNFARLIRPRIEEALEDTPVILLAGPRQAGKTTLVRQMAAEKQLQYFTLDDALTLLSAREDPVGMISKLDSAVIDEIQRAPELLLAIKKSVDEDRRPGRFLLTGSANLMALPTVADSLAGRMETLSLLPLSQSEIESKGANWIDNAFAGKILPEGVNRPERSLAQRVLKGGYPESISRTSAKRRQAWAMQYVEAIIQRDVRDFAGINKLDELPRFLRALAQTSGQMCNYAKLGGEVGLDGKTAAKYINVFEQMYLLKRVSVWARNRLNRLVKTPKLQFIDSGLLAALLNLSIEETHDDRTRFGHVLETFVFGELLKHAATSDDRYSLMYYRDTEKVEVDIVIENAKGQLVGVEIKAAATVKASDFHGLKKLADLAGKQFKMGVLLYDGHETLPVGEGLWAAPISTLWG